MVVAGAGLPIAMPGLTGNSAVPGGTLGAAVTTENGDLVILVIGLPGGPATVPGIRDAFWLDPVVHQFHTIAAQTSSGPVTGNVAVPNVAGFLGLRLGWQAVCYGPATGLQASNPAIVLVH